MRQPKYLGQWCWVLLIGVLFTVDVHAQDEPGPITNTYALKNVNIITRPGQMIKNGTVVVKNGLIHSAGQNVSIPGNAKILKADSMYVYAAFIDGASHVGTPKPKEEERGGRGSRRGSDVDPGNPGNVRAGITPDVDVQSKLDHKDKSITNLRKVGFGAVHSLPRGRMLPGSGAVILLQGDSNDDIVMKSNTSAYAQLRGAGGVYPATVIAVISKFRDLYRQAEQAKAHIAKYKANPSGLERPAYDDATMALIPVVSKTKPVYFQASDPLTISRVLQLQRELGFKLVLTGVKKGWHHASTLKLQNIPLYLSMDLPKKEENKKDKAKKGEDVMKKGKMGKGGGEKMAKKDGDKMMTIWDKEREDLMAKKKKSNEAYVGQAATMTNAGIQYGFSTEGTNAKDIHTNLRRMIEAGLPEDAALKALTTYPAQQLGLAQMLGTVERGKVANLMVTKMPYFDEKSKIAFMIVDGEVFEFDVAEKKKKKKSDASGEEVSAASLAGEWTFEIAIPGQSQTGTITIENDGGELSGFMVADQDDSGEESTLDDLTLDGNELTFSIDIPEAGFAISFVLDMEVDSFSGSANAGPMGSFEVTGDKVPQ